MPDGTAYAIIQWLGDLKYVCEEAMATIPIDTSYVVCSRRDEDEYMDVYAMCVCV